MGGTTKCSGACVDTKNDPANCGGCALACSLPNATAYCASSACAVGPCTAGYANCNNVASDGCEVNLNTDANHCGACGNACDGGSCVAGVCQ